MDPIKLTVLSGSTARKPGTFTICESCPSHKNCCARVAPNGEVDQPVLVPADVDRISRATGLVAESFSVPDDSNPQLRRMRSGSAGCHFYQGGRCAIYDQRPTDCRLFPYDVVERPDGRLVWIAYTDLCPNEYDPRAYLEDVRSLSGRLGEHLRAFARVQAPGMAARAQVEITAVSDSDHYGPGTGGAGASFP